MSSVPSFEQARRLVEQHAATAHPSGKELVALLDSQGLILAEPVLADRNFPPFPRATRDGYAVHAADLEKVPTTLQVIGEIRAGAAAAAEATFKLQPGQAAAIMTGAPAPTGSDAVVMVEYTSREGDQVTITRTIAAGDNIVPIAAEAKRGERLRGQGATDADIARIHAPIGLAIGAVSPPEIALSIMGEITARLRLPAKQAEKAA